MFVALCDFTGDEQRWFVHIHKQRTWRHGTTGEAIHGGWPMEMREGQKSYVQLYVTARILKDDGYRALNNSVCRSATIRYFALHDSLPPIYQVLRAYPHKLDVDEDINHARATMIKRCDGSRQLQDHVLYRMRMIEGKSFAEIMKYVRDEGHGSSWSDAYLRKVLVKLGAWPPVSATGEEKTGNTQRVTHCIHDVRLINRRFTSLNRGGKKAEKLGGLRCGGEESLEHFKKTLGWALERDAYVIDWETYTCIVPARMTGTDTEWWNKERDAQRTFFQRMKCVDLETYTRMVPGRMTGTDTEFTSVERDELRRQFNEIMEEFSPSSSSSGESLVVTLCAKPPPHIIEDRLKHVLQPKPKSPEDARRDALFAKGGWSKILSPTGGKALYFHEPSGYSAQEINRVERFQDVYERIILLEWTVKPHEKDGKPVFIPPKNDKGYRRISDVENYLGSKT